MSIEANIFSVILGWATIGLIATIPKTIEFYRRKNIHNKIQSCFYDSFQESQRTYRHKSHQNYATSCASHFLWNYYYLAEHKTNIEEKYRITDDEKDVAKDIIKTFQQWLLRLYLLGYSNSKAFTKMSTEHFLIERFVEFLSKNELETEFNNQEMFVSKRTDDGVYLYYLTDYSKVFFKMFYVFLMYYEQLEKEINQSIQSNNVKEYLENGYIKVIKYKY